MSASRPLRLLGLLFAVAIGGCSGEADSAVDRMGGPSGAKPAYGDTFIDALTGNISGLIPNVLTDSASFEVGSLIYSGLITRDKDLNIIGELAESWEFSRISRSICDGTCGGTTGAPSRPMTWSSRMRR
jgi:peptide/nickel transport system substrate-binding protein